jgi:hypothetical protein
MNKRIKTKPTKVTIALNVSSELIDILRDERERLAFALDNLLAFDDEGHPRHEEIVKWYADYFATCQEPASDDEARRLLRKNATGLLASPNIARLLKAGKR